VLRTRRTAEEIPRQTEAIAQFLLDFMLLAAIDIDGLPGFQCGKLGRRSVLVGGTDKERLPAPRPLKPRVNVGRKHRAHQIAQMLHAVDVRQGTRNEHARKAGTWRHSKKPLSVGRLRGRTLEHGCPFWKRPLYLESCTHKTTGGGTPPVA